MTTLNISLPDDLKRVVDKRVSEGNFASHSEYVRSLIREDQKRAERERVEAKLLERIQSGDSVAFTERDFAQIRSRLRSHLSQKAKSSGRASRKSKR